MSESNATKEGKLFVPDFEGPKRKERRNYIALELLKHSMASSQIVTVEECFKLANEFLDWEAK